MLTVLFSLGVCYAGCIQINSIYICVDFIHLNCQSYFADTSRMYVAILLSEVDREL